MTNAESTVKFAIFNGITSHWHTKDVAAMRDKIFEDLFAPHLIWALKEHLETIEPNSPQRTEP